MPSGEATPGVVLSPTSPAEDDAAGTSMEGAAGAGAGGSAADGCAAAGKARARCRRGYFRSAILTADVCVIGMTSPCASTVTVRLLSSLPSRPRYCPDDDRSAMPTPLDFPSIE